MPPPTPPPNPTQQAADIYLRTLIDTTKAVGSFGNDVKAVSAAFQKFNPFGSGVGAGAGGPTGRPPVPPLPTIRPLALPKLPVIKPLPVAKPVADRIPVGREIYPVRLVRFESQAYSQLASLLARGGGSGGGGGTGKGADKGRGELMNPFRPLAVAAAATTASLIGLTRAGLSGTVEGYKLDMQFTLLSRSIAGVFLPVVDKITERMQRLNFALMRMDGGQQNRLMKAGLGVGAVGAFGGGLAALSPVVGPVLHLFTGMVGPLMKVAGVGGPVTVVLGLVAAGVVGIGGGLAYLYTASKPVRDALNQVWAAMKKVWDATRPVRDALFDLAATLATEFFRELAREIGNIVNDPMVISFLKDMGKAIADMALEIPKFIKQIQELRDRFRDPEEKRGEELDKLIAANQAKMGGKLLQGINWNPFKRAPGEVWEPNDGKPGNARRPQPFQPGKEDAIGAADRFQQAFLKVDNDNIPKQQLDQLVNIVGAVQGVAVGLNLLGIKLDFGNRPAPNGRPRG